MIKLISYYAGVALLIFLLKQSGFTSWLHPDIAFIFVFLAFQSYLTWSLAQLGQKNEGEKFVQIQTASFAIRFIFSILFIAFLRILIRQKFICSLATFLYSIYVVLILKYLVCFVTCDVFRKTRDFFSIFSAQFSVNQGISKN